MKYDRVAICLLKGFIYKGVFTPNWFSAIIIIVEIEG